MTMEASEAISSPMEQDKYSDTRIKMWIFLFTDILLFGGLFLIYEFYRSRFPEDFHFCTGNLDTLPGTLITLLLLTSSLTMMLSTKQLEKQNRKNSILFLWITFGLGFLSLLIRYIEWSAKIGIGLFPDSTILQQHTPGENAFYGIFYLMTGIHALHIVIGMIVLFILWIKLIRKPIKATSRETGDLYILMLENTGLFWQVIILVWIFMFPIFYLFS